MEPVALKTGCQHGLDVEEGEGLEAAHLQQKAAVIVEQCERGDRPGAQGMVAREVELPRIVGGRRCEPGPGHGRGRHLRQAPLLPQQLRLIVLGAGTASCP